MIFLSHSAVLDCFVAAHTGRCLASLANTAHGLVHSTIGYAARNNACIRVSFNRTAGWRVRLVSTQPIAAGDEVFVPYSSGYRMPAYHTNRPDPPPTEQPPPSASTSLATVPPVVVDLVSPPASPPYPSAPVSDPGESPCVVDLRTPPTPSPPDPASPDPLPPPEPPPALLPPLVKKILNLRERRRLDKMPILSTADRDQRLVQETAQTATACCSILFPTSQIPVQDILTFLQEAHVAAADTRGVLAASRWGANFQFSALTVTAHTAEFLRHGNSLAAVARSRRAATISNSFSTRRVVECFGEDGSLCPALSPQDFQRLLRLAEIGVEIPRPLRFQSCAEPAELRSRYIEVQGAVHRLLAKQVDKGTVLLLPLQVAQLIPGIHLLNAQHWTTKKDQDKGRALADLSNVPNPMLHCPLNGHTTEERAAVNAACERLYGRIVHPTLGDLMRMITAMAHDHGWDNITLWKMDLQGAFNLLWFNPDDVALLAFPLVDELVVIHLVGLFGWAGMPFAFQVLNRALHALVSAAISGVCSWYVDDCCACSLTTCVSSDLTAAHAAITHLAGGDAVAEDKTETGRSLDFIGWQVNLDTRSVTLSPRNLLKVAHAFFCFDLAARVSRIHVERMASLASRVSVLSRFMRPFTRYLSLTAATFPDNPSIRHTLSAKTQCEVAMWRAFIIILRVANPTISRPIESFTTNTPTVAIRYDASLHALGVGVYAVCATGEALLCFTATPLPFAVSADSSRQNTCEYLAVLLGLALAAQRGLRQFSYTLYGDSVSSLAWVTADRVASDVARRANLALVVLSVHLDAHVASTIHVPGVLNTVYDGLSRGRSAAEVGLDPALQQQLTADNPAVQILRLCDPAVPITTAPEHLCFAGEVSRLVTALCPTVV